MGSLLTITLKNLYENCETKPLLTFEKGRNEGER